MIYKKIAVILVAAAVSGNTLVCTQDNNADDEKAKAILFEKNNQYLQAHQVYQQLFEEAPIHYRDLLRTAKILGMKSEQGRILKQAQVQFRKMIDENQDDVARWVDGWTNYVSCLKQLHDFSTAEQDLKGEIKKFDGDAEKEVFLKRELSHVYSERVLSKGRTAPSDIKKEQLKDLANSFELDPKNQQALQWLTILGLDKEIGAEAKKIYDPLNDPKAPEVVFSELGHSALKHEDYDQAIVLFERARKLNPKNPAVLNNLAYAYLISEEGNAEQALLLVDQAIVSIQKLDLGSKREQILSSFFDTRGEALMQLERFDEAAVAFEFALSSRPNSEKIIKQLIRCYQETGDKDKLDKYLLKLRA